MATLETISAALKLVEEKKENLRKAFEELQSHSSSLSTFNLTWSDLDSHFSSIQSSLEHKFKLLQSQPHSDQTPPNHQSPPASQGQPLSPKINKDKSNAAPVLARPELKSLCEQMKGLGLRNYIINRPKQRAVIGTELANAFKCARDAGAMVLDAIDGFFMPNSKGDKDLSLVNVRKACIVLFEGLMESKVEISAETRERAKSVALEWKGKVSVDGNNAFEPYGFLHLVASYGLVDVFSMDDLVDFAVNCWKFTRSIHLCRVLCFGDKISDLIEKLISKGKHLQAVRYVLEFELADKFPPLPLLKDYMDETKKSVQKILEDRKRSIQSLNEGTTKEIRELRHVVNIIEDHKLEAEFLKQSAMKRIEELEKEIANRKKPGPSPAPKALQQSKPQNNLSGMKRPRATSPGRIPRTVAFPSQNVATASPAVTSFQHSYSQPTLAALAAVTSFPTNRSYIDNASSTVQAYQQSYSQVVSNVATTRLTVPPYQQSYGGRAAVSGLPIASSAVPSAHLPSYSQQAGLLPDHHGHHLMSSQAVPHGMADSMANVPYPVSSAALHRSAEASLGPPGSSTHAQPHVYPKETNMAPSSFGLVNSGGNGLPPQHHPSYYPQ